MVSEVLVNVNDVEISFLRGKDLPIVYVHGSGCDAKLWSYQLKGVGGYAIDLPNHGQSYELEINSVDDYAYYVAEAVKKILDKAIFVGHSLGGAIVQKVYLNHKKIVKALILVGTGVRLRVLPTLLEELRNNPKKAVDTIVNMAFDRKVGEFEEIKEAFLENSKVLLRDLEICDKFDLLDDYKNGKIRIDMPTLIIVGNKDRLTPVKYSEFLNKQIEGSKLVVLDGGHMIMLEQPERLNEVINEFVENLI
ncbi:alpha/beta hydrolase [Archaeoglobales archaeon]|nr:MAG: alpha/beta hydrolase [Archaeoglobales archaeon]